MSVEYYDSHRSWEWNLTNAPPLPSAQPVAESANGRSTFRWFGQLVDSPLGIAAGPLLNAQWLLSYAAEGFDLLVYKTVRTRPRDCYPLPNLVPTVGNRSRPLLRTPPEDNPVTATSDWQGSWAVSFGMPSVVPDVWRPDVELARNRLGRGQRLIVSVVGAVSDNTAGGGAEAQLDALADDYALCGRWATEAGADAVEANFSCPNVCSRDGSLFMQPHAAGVVAERIREAVGERPLLLKIGHVEDAHQAAAFVNAVAPIVDGLVMTNAISAPVADNEGNLLFGGNHRGICGDAIREASVRQVTLFRRLIDHCGGRLREITGVGGISEPDHVDLYLQSGATHVAAATSVMHDRSLARRWKKCSG